MTAIADPFRLPHVDSTWRRFVRSAFERALGLPRLNRAYADAAREPARANFCERALDALDVRIDVADTEVRRIPSSGPLVVVANHPFGGIDGLSLAALVRRVRPDVKILGNRMLAAVPDMREMLLAVDVFGGSASRAANGRALRAALRWVRDGGALVVFPAGEVSRLEFRVRGVADGPWNNAAARIARVAQAPVIPVFFEGRNSALFQAAGLVHPLLRTALLPREMLKRRGTRVTVHVGEPVTPARLARFGDDADAGTSYLRLRTQLLGASDDIRPVAPRTVQWNEPLGPRIEPDALADDVARLPSDRLLASSGVLSVHYAAADELPAVLPEIGRLREATFRVVGEGTGRASDLDRFDEHYLHLFVWNRDASEIVGAYRLGLTDQVLPRLGADGLYTSTLFHYRDRLLRQLTPAIELGRSFVRAEYQKEYAPLLLLWKGIGRFVAREPRYRLLFGTVSISNEYRSLSKQILMAFLQANRALPGLGRLLVPRNPPRFDPPRRVETTLAGTMAGSIEEVDELLAEIESDGRRSPVLLRQYLKLGAHLLGFNIDPDFGHVLDGLMLVDLMRVDPVLLSRYLGKENLESFYSHHATPSAE